MADDFPAPPAHSRNCWLRYGASICFVLVALALRAAFDKFLGDAHPFLFFLAAIAVAAWYGGFGPALLALTSVAEKITGWRQQEVYEQPLQKCFQIRNELTGQPIDDPVAKVLRDGIIVGLANHTVLVSRTGREIPIDDSAAPIFDPAGKLLGAVMVFRDVSEQRAAELARRRLAAIVEDSDDAIISKDIKGIIITWNFSPLMR